MFDDTDAVLFGGSDCDLFGGSVTCIAGELELQVQSYECGTGDLCVVGDSSAVALTKDSGGSSLSAIAPGELGDADFMENVSLEVLAAADHYGHTVCAGRQSTADSGTARNPPATAAQGWTAPSVPAYLPPRASGSTSQSGMPSQPPAAVVQAPAVLASVPQPQPAAPLPLPLPLPMPITVPVTQQRPQQADNHSHGHESSDCDMSHTVGDGESSGVKGTAHGSSHSEASEDNSAGFAPSSHGEDEYATSMPSFGGLSLSRLRARPCAEGPAAPAPAPGAASSMPRAYSVDNFAGASAASASGAAAAHRAANMMRSYSCAATDTLPMEFQLGCGDSSSELNLDSAAFGSRGRCFSLNEQQLRKQWLAEGELLAPQLPPSVDELELLELPEDNMPSRPFSAGVAGHVKRKIITSPSPLLAASRGSRTRTGPLPPGTMVPAPWMGGSAEPKSPKRARVGTLPPWPEAGGMPPTSSAGLLAGWPSSAAPRGGGGMKSVRSMPANMHAMTSFLDGVEVTVQPLGVPTAPEAAGVISPNSSCVSASTPLAPAAQSAGAQAVAAFPGRNAPFFDPATGQAAGARPGTVPLPLAQPAPPVSRGGKSKGAAQQPLPLPLPMPQPVLVPGQPAPLVPGLPPGFTPGLAFPDTKRPVPSVPKPRKRASPNGNPPKAPAPNPNGHCCTQCGTQTTPVWRAGPHGPKTLCNACGVRYMKVAKGNQPPAPRRQQHQ
ncbi:hypothetical protein HYH03_013849 [Edaphochlamys debaryana]|uniref:GATA-type domain-containing protein n=1 Tax=Edaphochlamys debaryana TaxID=47281 RepID=A0A836BSS8_9CHLO|nr:hypothetical protein HYH03_013849 [Edaphochlamys debaryana]|eukprot:KAG2487570.1 hypothetical protein HYH03_013849 [Edaphochlamys debaryana]